MRCRRYQPVLAMTGCCLALLPLCGPQVCAQETQQQKIAKLIHNLKSPEPRVRSSAARKLGRMRSSAASAVPALIERLKDNDPPVRLSATIALAQMGSSAAFAVSALR